MNISQLKLRSEKFDNDEDDDSSSSSSSSSSIEMSNKRLTSMDLFAETEGLLTAIQDQVILTRNYKKYILKQPNIDELCRRHGEESETIQHITTACEQLAPTECVKRHDGLAEVIHQLNWQEKRPYYKYTPASDLENKNFKLHWNCSIRTGKKIAFNRSDITIMNKKTKNTVLIDIAVPNTYNPPKQ